MSSPTGAQAVWFLTDTIGLPVGMIVHPANIQAPMGRHPCWRADMVFGGVGADVFALLALKDTTVDPAGQDTIGDFSALAGDLIGLSALDADTGTGGDQAFTFIGNAAFSAVGQARAVVIGGMTVVSGNVNADLGADFAVRLRVSFSSFPA